MSINSESHMKVCVFINAHSGAVQAAGVDALIERLEESFERAGETADITCGEASEFGAFCDRANCPGETSMAVFAGGDGTFAMAAEAFSHTSIPVAFLPAGTMNLIAHDLGVGGDLGAAIDDLMNWRPRKIDVAWINDRAFLNNIVFGDYAEIAEARELLRSAPTLDERLGAISEAAHTLFHSTPARFRIADGAETIDVRSNMLMIANNLYSGAAGVRPTRDCLDRGKLAIYLAQSLDGADMIARLLEVLQGDLSSSETIEVRETERCVVRTEDNPVTVAIDGEPVEMTNPVEIRIEAGALTVLAPVAEAK